MVFACDKTETGIENSNDFTGTSGTFIDQRDNITYKWVKIGEQIWMAENLKATKYNDGSDIPNVTEDIEWFNLKTGAYCWYNNDASANKNIYGALYNWYAVNTGKLAPKGWHIPTDEEWIILENSLIVNGFNYDGTTSGNKIAKSMADKTSWALTTKVGTPGMDLPSNNRSGFSGRAGGQRITYYKVFNYIGEEGIWWSSTNIEVNNSKYGINSEIFTHLPGLMIYNSPMSSGFSIRCIKD